MRLPGVYVVIVRDNFLISFCVMYSYLQLKQWLYVTQSVENTDSSDWARQSSVCRFL
jgi:hypothetical protein